MNLTTPQSCRLICGIIFTGVCGTGFWSGAASAASFFPGDIAAVQAAITTATSNGESDVIDLGGQAYVLDSALVITPEDNLLEIKNGTLERAEGSAPTRLVEITRAGTSFDFSFSNRVIFSDMIFRNGRVDVGDSATNESGGGAILGNWSLEINGSRFENNAVVGNGSGGAILSSGMLSVLDSVFVNNSALSDAQGTAGIGGAIVVKQQAFRIDRNSFIGNRANSGGALHFPIPTRDNTTFIQQSFFSDNTATSLGGAVFSAKDRLIVSNSTLVNNSAGTGGGAIYSQSQGGPFGNTSIVYGVQVRFSALIDNTTTGGSGGGGLLGFFSSDTGVSMISSIFGGNTGGNCARIGGASADFTGQFETNISDDATCGNNGVAVINDVRTLFAGDLAQNGGPTPTFALTPDSLAVDGVNTDGAFCELFDQRGVRRPSGGLSRPDLGEFCDIGPYELEGNDIDTDNDGIADFIDNCPGEANANQADLDGDGDGDACDDVDNRDQDNDGVQNFQDNCPTIANPEQTDSDNDGLGDPCDSTPTGDVDEDGVDDDVDNCRTEQNPNQEDTDEDGAGDACDTTPNGDDDNDSIDNLLDNCPDDANPNQVDSDGDGVGDACDATPSGDTDNDGIDNALDNCPTNANPNQTDTDGDGIGDVCDATPNGDDDNEDAGINGEVTQAADNLNQIIAGTNGFSRRVLNLASRQLTRALRDTNWSSNNVLVDNRARRVFTNVANALNQIERIADSRDTSSVLRSEFDMVSAKLLDSIRALAENKIADAIATNGNQRRIARARSALEQGDRARSNDRLNSAATRYGNAWSRANSAL